MPSILLRRVHGDKPGNGSRCPPYAGRCDTAHFQAMSLVRFAEAVEIPPISLPDLTGKEVRFHSFRAKSSS